ncbi:MULTISPECIES: formate/nitrite transporter family protein [Lysinibacillus]|uniref:Formate/nitrite transporter family protein n=1 Tax=Lysinibacillus antri TaxID=2498145 RepID=A0A432LFB2_9BACI|nr:MULTISPECIES: formate/nitrite transporter family protein [Lysinibacillus]RUL56366.1 formate/nitrite transporter family protein [Lysinibacillus antri]TSI07040.1 formate/nitrite transporter family protein [Lysinibacillus sp. BW-2-10]
MRETFEVLSNAAITRVTTLNKSKISYLMLTMLGGIFVGFGIIILITIGGLLDPVGSPYMKIIQGISFGVALSMVIMGGADLFTGNHLIMTAGMLEKTTTWMDTMKIWIASFIGNLIGSILCAFLYFMTGLHEGAIGNYIDKIASIKMNAPFWELLFRGILCNVLVCLATWCSFRLKSESAKLVMIFCCIYPFITAGFEHSVANMTLLSLALMIPHSELVTVGGFFANLIPVSIGNIIGGAILIGTMFWYGQVDKK